MYYNCYQHESTKIVYTQVDRVQCMVDSFYDTIKSYVIPVLCQCSYTKTSGLKPNKINRKKGLEAPQCMCNITESLMSACKGL